MAETQEYAIPTFTTEQAQEVEKHALAVFGQAVYHWSGRGERFFILLVASPDVSPTEFAMQEFAAKQGCLQMQEAFEEREKKPANYNGAMALYLGRLKEAFDRNASDEEVQTILAKKPKEADWDFFGDYKKKENGKEE